MNALEPPRVSVLAWLTVAAVATVSCGAEERDPGVENATTASFAESDTTDPERFFSDLEDRLLQHPESRIGFRITADGAFTAALEGELFLGDENDVALSSQGTFGPDSVSLSLRVADGRLIGGNGDRSFEEPVPAGLREALVIGLTRMGLLHNLARLVSASPPDRADGNVRDWVRVREVAWTAPDSATGGRGVSFDVWVDEQPTADAVLWFDDRGRPVGRDQTVRFPGGEMRVRERYEIR